MSTSRSLTTTVSWITAAWLLVMLLAGAAGLFRSEGPPIALGAAIGIPPVLVLALLARSARFRNWVRSLDLRTLTLLQTWRAVGLAFLALWSVGALPGGFALPASYGDVAVGVTAPFVAAFILGRGRAGRVAYLGWTAFGIIDLLAAITLGILYSPTSVGVLSGGAAGPGVMGQLPMSLIPTFGVPFTLALHAISVYAARQADWTAPGARRVATPVGKVAAGR